MRAAAAALALVAAPAWAQESGWHYSPLPGEGDRTALGCAYGATQTEHTCVAVRCEDDFSIGLHIHTSRPGGDAGRWRFDIDKDSYEIVAISDAAPYGARVDGDVAVLLDGLKHGAVVHLDPLEGADIGRNLISLSGSMTAINQALYFCAPRVVPEEAPETPPG